MKGEKKSMCTLSETKNGLEWLGNGAEIIVCMIQMHRNQNQVDKHHIQGIIVYKFADSVFNWW